jgi:hypothetical protein
LQTAARSFDVASGSHRDQFFHYLGEMGINVNATRLIPQFAYDTHWSEIWEAIEDACVATYEFLRLWATVLWLLAVPLARLLTSVLETLLPHFLIAVELVAQQIFELDPVYQTALAITTLFAFICYRQGYISKLRRRYVAFRRDMQDRYRVFVASLSKQSRVIALALPHAVFLVAVYLIVFWSPPLVLDLWDNKSLTVLLSIVIPLGRSISAIHRRRKQQRLEEQAAALAATSPAASTAARRPGARAGRPQRPSSSSAYNEWRPYEACLKYWVLWSIATCVTSVVSLFIPSFIAAYLSVPTYWINILLAWMHSPVARGDIALYTLMSPLVNPYANRLEDASDTPARSGYDRNGEPINPNNQASMLWRALELVGVMRQQHVHLLKDLWSQGPALGGLMFIFTPGFVTARGALLVGFGFPAYVSMGALADKRTRTYEWWLQYFVVAVVVDYVVTAVGDSIAWLPLFYHAKLLLMMWLQFPYFRGAKTIFDNAHTSIFVAARPVAVAAAVATPASSS